MTKSTRFRRPRRAALGVLAGAATLVLALPSTALAATNAATPASSWGVSKSCGSTYPNQNCAEVYATAEDPNTGTLFAAGDFTAALNPSSGTTEPHDNLVAIKESSGAPAAGFAGHSFNGSIYAAAVDPAAGLLYVGGAFTSVDGATESHVAAFRTADGSLDRGFTAKVNNTVRSLLLTGNRLYIGGRFTAVAKQTRTRLAALNAATGALDTSFAPPSIKWTETTKSQLADVRAIALGADQNNTPMLYVGGHFDTVGGNPHSLIVRLSASTGALDNSYTPQVSTQSGDDLADIDKIVYVGSSVDGTAGILAAQAAHINRGYRFNLDGTRKWMLKPDGDMQTVALHGSSVYFGGHFTCVAVGTANSCLKGGTGGVESVHLVAVAVGTGAIDQSFQPKMMPTTQPYFWGVWSLQVTHDGSLWAGGDFKTVQTGGTTYQRPKLAVFPSR